VKALQRRMVVGLGLAVVASVPTTAEAQYGYNRPRGPTTDTPHILVGTCHSTPRQIGVDASKELRERIQTENNPRDLYVIPNKDVNAALAQSGYTPDSALSMSDLGALGKIVHADEILDCDAAQTAAGVRVEVRMLLASDVTKAQPLPPVEARNFSDAAKDLERENTLARKQLDGYDRCRRDLLDGKLQQAAKEAHDAIGQYQQATLARLCLASVYADKRMNYSPDSVLALTDEILKIDPKNSFALRIAIGAYDAKKDQTKEIGAMERLFQLEPQNQTLALQIVDALAASPDPSKALPILQDLLKRNPGDPNYLQQLWKLQAKLNMYSQALVTGEQMVQSDTSLADSSYYHRQIAMASQDSNWAKVAQYAQEGEKKSTRDAQFAYLGGVALRNIKQYPEAAVSFRRAFDLDTTNTNARLYLAQTFADMGQTDSVVAIADNAIKAGADKEVWGSMLIAPAQDAFTAAQADTINAPANFQKAFKYAIHADSLAPSKYTKFFTSVSAFQIATSLYRDAAARKDCDLAKQANDLFTTTQVFLPEGGSVSPETASNILKYLPQLSDATGQMIKAYCKKK
jgi:predicted Zn-dependent protease